MLCEGFFKLKDDIPDYLIWGYHMVKRQYSKLAYIPLACVSSPFCAFFSEKTI